MFINKKLVTKKNILNSSLIIFFVIINLSFIFLQIHKQSQFVKLSYRKQQLEKEQDQLVKHRNELVHKIYLQQNPKAIKQYATHELNMRDTSVTQIHKLEEINETQQ